MENILVIIEYESENDLTFLDENTKEIFTSYKNYGQGKQSALSIISASKQSEFTSKSMKVQILEKNPDMNNYVLLYHPIKNQGSKLAGLGKVYLLSENHSLVRLNEGKVFSQTGEYAKFMIVPLQTVSLRTTNAISQKEAAANSTLPMNLSKTVNIVIIAVIFGLILIVIFSIIFWKRLRKQES